MVGCSVTIPLDIVLIPGWGILGAAAASSLSYMASSVAITVFFVHDTKIPLRQVFVIRRGDVVPLRERLMASVAWLRER